MNKNFFEKHLQPREIDIIAARKDPLYDQLVGVLQEVENHPESCDKYREAVEILSESCSQIGFDSESLSGEWIRIHKSICAIHREICPDFIHIHGDILT